VGPIGYWLACRWGQPAPPCHILGRVAVCCLLDASRVFLNLCWWLYSCIYTSYIDWLWWVLTTVNRQHLRIWLEAPLEGARAWAVLDRATRAAWLACTITLVMSSCHSLALHHTTPACRAPPRQRTYVLHPHLRALPCRPAHCHCRPPPLHATAPPRLGLMPLPGNDGEEQGMMGKS
jgi:hypothetical protein